jgi:hypothetical protein
MQARPRYATNFPLALLQQALETSSDSPQYSFGLFHHTPEESSKEHIVLL